MEMKVTCELSIGNDVDYPSTKIYVIGEPTSKSGFIHLKVEGKVFEVRPFELIEAVNRTRSDGVQ